MPEVKEENRVKRPTTKQVYMICHELCERTDGVEFPKNRQEASELIGKLKAHNESDG